MRRRLDVELVRRGLVPTREAAQAAIAGGGVVVSGTVADKAARQVGADEPVELQAAPRFVSRGGEKLDAALARFGVEVGGLGALDAGASTGGFTDCLLQRGAASVLAVDVGHGQLHPRLRADPRVTVLERTNIRELEPGRPSAPHLGPFAVVVADLSFISLVTVVPALTGLAAPGAVLVLLVKPQFEVGRVEASRGRGVIRRRELHRQALASVASAAEEAGASIMGAMPSPLLGRSGNVEFLLAARVPDAAAPAPRRAAPAGTPSPAAAAVVDSAVDEAHDGARPAPDPEA